MAKYVQKLLRPVFSRKRVFLLFQIMILWVLTVYCHTQSYTFHTEIEIVYKDLKKYIVICYVYSIHVCVRA